MNVARKPLALRRFVLTTLTVLCLIPLLAVGTGAGQRGEGGRGGGATEDPVARVLNGAVDIHVHPLPDSEERTIDAFEVAMMARAHGMRGLVLKNHYESTEGLAYLVRKLVPGVEVFGGIDLNLTVGGMNPAAVEHMTRVAGGWGRLVWMSTYDAEHYVRARGENRPFVTVSRNGELLPATKEVIAVIAKHGLVLATGHVAPEECLMIVREGRRQGVQHMLITHPMSPSVGMNLAQMQAATKEGAFIEIVGSSMFNATAAARVDSFAEAIRKIGPEFVILSSDLGLKGGPLPADGFAAFILAMRAKGFTDQELDRMTKQNPARLLGLP